MKRLAVDVLVYNHFEVDDGSHESYITLGVADTAIIKDK